MNFQASSNDRDEAALKKLIENHLEEHGWKREVAGDEDFNAIVEAIYKISTDSKFKRMGIILSGEYGVGKTTVAKLIANCPAVFNMSLQEQVDYLEYSGYADYINKIMTGDVILDDVGAETIRNNFGTKVDLVGSFITRFHLKGTGRLFITTNLHGDELAERYGGRVISRLKDLCIPVPLHGVDKRKWII